MNYNYQDSPRESQQEYFGKKTKRVVDLENQVRFMGMQIDNLKAICRTDNTETLQNALKRIEELEAQIEKMKNWCNCKNYQQCLIELAEQGKGMNPSECCRNCKKWEIKEND